MGRQPRSERTLYNWQAFRKSITERIRAKDVEINEVKAEQQQQRSLLDSMRSKEDHEMGDIPGLMAEKERLYEEIKGIRELVNTMRAEFKVKEDAWWANEKALRAQQKEEKQKKCAVTLNPTYPLMIFALLHVCASQSTVNCARSLPNEP